MLKFNFDNKTQETVVEDDLNTSYVKVQLFLPPFNAV